MLNQRTSRRQPGRGHVQRRGTFENFLKILLGKGNFNYKKEVDGRLLAQSCWSHCLSYECEIRKEACKKCRTRSMGHRRSSQNNLRGQRAQDAALGTAGRNRERFQGVRRDGGEA